MKFTPKNLTWRPITDLFIDKLFEWDNNLTLLDVKLFFYLAKNMEPLNNCIIVVQSNLSNKNQATDNPFNTVAESSISKSMSKLKSKNMIAKTKNAQEFMINPNITYIGKDRLESLVQKYEELQKYNKIKEEIKAQKRQGRYSKY